MPDKRFYSAGKVQYCFNMKRIRLEDVYRCLLDETYEVELDPVIMEAARKPLERMIAAGK